MDSLQIWPPEDNGETLELIRSCAKRLLHKSGLPASDLDDLEQQIGIELWKQSAKFDPAHGTWRDFTKARASQAGLKYIRFQYAEKRNRHRCQSLNDRVTDQDGRSVQLATTISSEQIRRHRYYESKLPSIDQSETFCLVSQLDKVLPPTWRGVVGSLERPTLSHLAKAVGLKRTTLNSRLRKVREGYSDHFSF